MLRVLGSVTIDIQEGKSRLLEEMQSLTQDEKDSMMPILKGIKMRLGILKDLEDASTSDPEVEVRLSAIFEGPLTATTPPEKEVAQIEAFQHKQNASNVVFLIKQYLTDRDLTEKCYPSSAQPIVPYSSHYTKLQIIRDLNVRKQCWTDRRCRLLVSDSE